MEMGTLFAAGMGMQAAGSLVQGYQAKMNAEYNARVARQEAVYQQRKATLQSHLVDRDLHRTKQEARIMVQRTREDTFRELRRDMGSFRARMGASNVQVDSGSSADVQKDMAGEAIRQLERLDEDYYRAMEQSEQDARIDKALLRFGADVSSSRSESEANMVKLRGRSKMVGGFMDAGTSLLTGYSTMKREGMIE